MLLLDNCPLPDRAEPGEADTPTDAADRGAERVEREEETVEPRVPPLMTSELELAIDTSSSS